MENTVEDSCTIFKYILHDMMLIGSETRKVGHDLDFKFILSDISYCKMYVIMNNPYGNSSK